MLESAVSRFLEQLPTERSFDAPLLALLSLHGFVDIAFVHGSFEFGKDFLATRVEEGQPVQYFFQSKLGDITKSAWEREIRPQCETMADCELPHPSFRSGRKRKNVLVFTGDFKGQTHLLAGEYQKSLARRGLPAIEFWSKHTLVERLSAESCLGGTFDWAFFGHFVTEARERAGPSIAEEYSQRWINTVSCNTWRATLEYAVVRTELERNGLHFHAFRLLLGLVRCLSYEVSSSGSMPDANQVTLLGLLRNAIAAEAAPVLEWTQATGEMDFKSSLVCNTPGMIVMAGVRMALFSEMVSLALLSGEYRDKEFVRQGRQFFEKALCLGATARPISDDYSVSVMSTAVAAAALDLDPSRMLLGSARWVAESYDGDDPVGLASARSNPEEELWRVMAPFVANPHVVARRETTLGAAVLDACSMLGLKGCYEDSHHAMTRNDLLTPRKLLPSTEAAQYSTGLRGCSIVLGGEYPPKWQGRDGWMNGDSHALADSSRWFDECGFPWIGVALSMLLRDRWWIHSFRRSLATMRQDLRRAGDGEPGL